MPLITLTTNVKLGSEDDTRLFVSEFSKFCSETIGKPEDRFSIDFHHNPYLAMKGTFGPAVRLHVMSLYNTTPENARKWSEAFFKFFENKLGVPADRGHFAFTDPGDQFIGVGFAIGNIPLVSLSTNAKFESEDVKKTLVSDFSKFCAKTLGKEEKIINVDVHFNPYLTFGGTFDPAIMLKIISLDNVNPTNSHLWSKEFAAFFEAKLVCVWAFTDPGPAFIGWMGATIEALREAPAE